MAINCFDWDPKKALANEAKHGVSFRRAAQVFDDPRALTVFDVWHSGREERWYTIGFDHASQLLVVHHVYRRSEDGEALIRVISCRKPSVKEKAQYLGRKA